MLPTLALVGRPNVGKSTLFNRLTRSRDAIVHDLPGLTRDRHYGRGRIGERPFLVVDTGGLEPDAPEGGIMAEMARQSWQAVDEADAVLFLVDGREGPNAVDREVATRLRRARAPVYLVVNKCEGMRRDMVTAEFHELGLGEPMAISAAHGDGVSMLVDEVLDSLGLAEDEPPAEGERGPEIAIVGRPNVGKSTLVNALLGEERMIAYDQPGTTRDSVRAEFERDGRTYTLIDTAGVRRRGKVTEAVEKFSVIKAMQAVESASVAVLVLDARAEVAEQDASIAAFIVETGRALVVAVNKWDGLPAKERETIKHQLGRKLDFLRFARTIYISAKEGRALGELLRAVDDAHAAAMAKLSTPKLTRVLLDAVARQTPPRHGMQRPKLRYAHQGGSNPPVVVIHGNALDKVPDSYRRYLEGVFRKEFKLDGTPLRVVFRQGANPYAER